MSAEGIVAQCRTLGYSEPLQPSHFEWLLSSSSSLSSFFLWFCTLSPEQSIVSLTEEERNLVLNWKGNGLEWTLNEYEERKDKKVVVFQNTSVNISSKTTTWKHHEMYQMLQQEEKQQRNNNRSNREKTLYKLNELEIIFQKWDSTIQLLIQQGIKVEMMKSNIDENKKKKEDVLIECQELQDEIKQEIRPPCLELLRSFWYEEEMGSMEDIELAFVKEMERVEEMYVLVEMKKLREKVQNLPIMEESDKENQRGDVYEENKRMELARMQMQTLMEGPIPELYEKIAKTESYPIHQDYSHRHVQQLKQEQKELQHALNNINETLYDIKNEEKQLVLETNHLHRMERQCDIDEETITESMQQLQERMLEYPLLRQQLSTDAVPTNTWETFGRALNVPASESSSRSSVWSAARKHNDEYNDLCHMKEDLHIERIKLLDRAEEQVVSLRKCIYHETEKNGDTSDVVPRVLPLRLQAGLLEVQHGLQYVEKSVSIVLDQCSQHT